MQLITTMAAPELSVILLECALFALVLGVIAGLRPLLRSARSVEPQPFPGEDDTLPWPKLSVIVHTFADADRLPAYLESLLQQDYPDFEVIVVCSANAETTETISEAMAEELKSIPGADGRLYFTFIPPGSRQLSRRKLAVTLGMKAAHGEVCVTTHSNCDIPSPLWLRDMARPFARSSATELALGYTSVRLGSDPGWGRWYRQFDMLVAACSWISMAAARRPYRGDGFNLAMRRQLFFKHKGYARSVYLLPGDDDLFVAECATRTNTALVLSPASILSVDWGEASRRVWTMRKSQYDFTARLLPQRPFINAAIGSLMQWAMPLLCIGAAVAGWVAGAVPQGWPLWLPTIFASLILLLWWGLCIFAYRRAASRLGAVRLWWAVVPFMIWRPVANIIFRLQHRGTRDKNYNWRSN